MTSGIEEQKHIDELKELKTQLRWWRWGLLSAAVVVAATCVFTVEDAFNGLTKKGPRQEKFVAEMTSAMKNEVVPRVEDMVKETFNEVKPEVQKSVDKVNARMPQLAETALHQLDQLQTDLPEKGEKVLASTFGEMLTKKEAKLKEMFPEATDEQIERLLHNLADSGTSVAGEAATELFSKHHETLLHIHENLMKIHESEPVKPGADQAWDLGLSVLDLFREDLRNMRPDQPMMASNTENISAAQKVSK